MSDSEEHGFTLIELTITMVVFVPILLAVLSTAQRVGRTLSASEKSAEAAEGLQRITDRAGRLIRAAHLSTFRVKAEKADVKAGRASAIGEWMAVVNLDPRDNIQFQASSASLSSTVVSLTTPRELEFVMDANETDNDRDDDGDGLVDEGRLFLRYESFRVPILGGVEACSFQLDGQAFRLVDAMRQEGPRRPGAPSSRPARVVDTEPVERSRRRME